MKKLILIKLGGSLITNKNIPYTPKPEIIFQLAKEIKKAYLKGFSLVVAHGSGSFGHTLADKYKTADGLKKKKDLYGLCLVQQDAIAINRIVNKIFLENKIPCLSFFPSSFSLAENKRLGKIFVDPIIEALKRGIVPLVFGDIIVDKRLGCCIFSGETTLDNLAFEFLSRGLKIEKIIHCGATEGVYDEEKKIVSKITPNNFAVIKKVLGKSAALDVTGGMFHKVEESLRIAKTGIDVWIIDGQVKGNLYQAIVSQPTAGTLITHF